MSVRTNVSSFDDVRRALTDLKIAFKTGEVTLAGAPGSATVAATWVGEDTPIFVTRITPGGTIGHLNTGTRTAGTSFTITSSANETSTVAWLAITL